MIDEISGIEDDIKKKIIAVISALIPQAKIILFGSRSRGTHSKWSDIDLALDAGKRLPIIDVGDLVSMFKETSIPYKIEIVDFHGVSEKMQASILRDGVVWKK